MPYPPAQDWRTGLALDRHDDPTDTEGWAALAENEQERREELRRDEGRLSVFAIVAALFGGICGGLVAYGVGMWLETGRAAGLVVATVAVAVFAAAYAIDAWMHLGRPRWTP